MGEYRWALTSAAASAALLTGTWLASFHLALLSDAEHERADQKTSVAFYDLTSDHYRPHLDRTLHIIVSFCSPSHYVYLASLSVVLALLRKAFPAACAAGVVLIGANLTTLVLKAVLPEPQTASLVGFVVPVPYPRWPSGHSTAAMALVVAVVLAAPPRLRPFTAGVGAVFAAAVGYSVLAFGTHLPSDVFGGFLVACTWALVAIAGLIAYAARAVGKAPATDSVPMREALGPAGAALLVLAAAAGIAVLVSPHAVISYARDHQPFVPGGLAIAALSIAISTAVALGIRGLRP